MESLLESGIKGVFRHCRILPYYTARQRRAGMPKVLPFWKITKKWHLKGSYVANSLRGITQLQGVISPERRQYGKTKE